MKRLFGASLLLLTGCGISLAQQPIACTNCALWNQPQMPFRIYGETYYVGPHGLTSLLLRSDKGLVLIDGALPESASAIAANIRTLGFRVEDIKLILSSHVHFDHAGGIAELQRMSGAKVVASPWSASVMKSGGVSKDDPQLGDIRPIDPVKNVHTLKDGETLHLGRLALTAHFTPGHTPGGTSWTWEECEAGRCEHMVYFDSATAVSPKGYLYTQHPDLVAGFEKTFTFLETTPCDILLTPHSAASSFWERVGARDAGKTPDPLIDPTACRTLAETSRKGLKERLDSESR